MPLPQNKYQVATGRSVDELRGQVVKYMEAGFVPIGGICVLQQPQEGRSIPGHTYYQAMWEPLVFVPVGSADRFGPGGGIAGSGGSAGGPARFGEP